jgi:polyhydroxybutyrate depolymerase
MRHLPITLMSRLRLPGLVLMLAASTTFSQQSRGPVGLETKQWTIGGDKRTAVVALPKVFPAAGAPLVLVFHGHGGTAVNMTRAMPIHTEWPEALVIYAQGLPAPGAVVDNEGKRAGWQNAPGALNDRDVKFVDSLLTWAKGQYRIDAKRVFATGHSNGGWFTYVLWATRPDSFTAFAPASAVFGRMAVGAKPKPALIIAGEKDRLVPFTLQRGSISTVVRLNGAEPKGEAWFGGAELHKSTVATVATYVYPGAHPLPKNAAAVVTRFFKERGGR